MIKLFQVVRIPRSRSLIALGIFEVVSTLAGELDYLVGSLPVKAELPILRVLGVSNNLPLKKISNKKILCVGLSDCKSWLTASDNPLECSPHMPSWISKNTSSIRLRWVHNR